MIGNLEPEEQVMDESLHWADVGLMDTVQEAIQTLGWDSKDNIAVEIGGTQVYEIDGAGTKWAPTEGTRKYNKDAFIVIKNLDRNPVISSRPNPNLKAHHAE
jgi:hypothetical protein